MRLYIACLYVCAYVCAHVCAHEHLELDPLTLIQKYDDCLLIGLICDNESAVSKRHVEAFAVGCKECTPKLKRDVGRADLYPFSSGGGMIFNPFHRNRDVHNHGLSAPGGLPRGAVPPEARFDPIGPLITPEPSRRQYPPDADHLPPPEFNNMYI